MNEQKKDKLVEIHHHVDQALSILMQHFNTSETDRLNRQSEDDVEAVLRHTKNVMTRLLAVNGKQPQKDLEAIERMYAEEASMQEIEKAEERAEKEVEQFRNYTNKKELCF